MKRPTTASLKRVTAENLATLGAERLAELLVSAAATRPELKRRLRMELAAEQGADHLVAEIDKRLASLTTSRGKISWRQRPSFVRDFDALRVLIVERLAALDQVLALDRLWSFLDLAPRLATRLRDRDGELAAVFAKAAAEIGELLGQADADAGAEALAAALARQPSAWAVWLPIALPNTPTGVIQHALASLVARPGATTAWLPLVRLLADAAGDIETYRASFSAEALKAPAVAAEIAQRLMVAERIDEAGKVLEAARQSPTRPGLLGRKPVEPDFAWETAWIDYLERIGQAEAAQGARWASFERTLSLDRAKAFVSRLADFDDVEAENRAFAHAAAHSDLAAALGLLVEWPALLEASQLILARRDDIDVDDDKAEAWSARLKPRYPAAAELLLRKTAAKAFRRRDFKTSDRLTALADAISPEA
jgi:hypothetical protein